MQKNLELRDITSGTSMKKLHRCRSFHFRYMELCRAKNLTPQPEIRSKNNANTLLDFFAEKLGVTDWLLVMESLYYDQVLQTLSIRLRKSLGIVLEHMDTEKKARLFKQKPVICTKFVFSGIVEAVSNCLEFNKNLRILNLEGLPLNDKYVESIAKALSSNEGIKEISFQRSNIYDKGCEAICNTIKYLDNIEKLNLSECELTTKGAEHVADMIKIQKISRYTTGWQKSLRYREVDPDSMSGLRSIALARNPQIGDDGVKAIVEILKEDVWVKVIDMENCGLTDRAANLILDCLEVNNYIIDFNVRGNAGMSKFLQRNIREQLGKEDEDQKILEAQQLQNIGGDGPSTAKKIKVTVTQMKEQVKTLQEQLAFERTLRKKAEQLNVKLNQQIIDLEDQLMSEASAGIPEGYVVVKNESLESIIQERNEFQKIATAVCQNNSPPNNTTRRLKQQNAMQMQLSAHSLSSKSANDLLPLSDRSSNSDATTLVTAYQASPTLTVKEAPRKTLKVRKVKSEMKYIETSKDTNKKKESKSDHEFANETDFQLSAVHFETNIGDTIANNMMPPMMKMQSPITPQSMQQINQITNRFDKKSICTPILNKIEIEDLSLSTSRTSDGCSSDSDTLRNTAEYQPMKVFIRRSNKCMTPHPQQQIEQGQGDYGAAKSPRSLFLGLCDD